MSDLLLFEVLKMYVVAMGAGFIALNMLITFAILGVKKNGK